MADELIGRGIIEVVADGTSVAAGMEQATAAVDRFEKAAVDAGKNAGAALGSAGKQGGLAGEKLDATTRRFIASLERESQQVGRTRAEYLELRASQLGVSDTTAAMIARIRESEKVVAAVGMSAKQTAAAMRGVPAQLTDIAVSLQGGQNPLTVLLQQGGQLKDMFGGITPAAKALGGTVLGLINPFTLAAAGATALGAAYYYGSEQSSALTRSLIASGAAAGMSRAELEAQIAVVGAITGQYGTAREAVIALSEAGTFTGDRFRTALRGVVAGTEATGRSVGDLVKTFEEIGKSPSEAIAKLNDRYNFLTSDVYKQIKALEEQGRTQDAATLAFNSFADSLESRRAAVVDNLGYIERGWRLIKEEIAAAAQTAAGIGRASTVGDQLAVARNQLASMQATVGAGGAFPGSRAEKEIQEQQQLIRTLESKVQAENDVAEAKGRQAEATKAAIKQEEILSKYLGGDNRFTKSGRQARDIAEEEKAFQIAVQGITEGTAKYQQALTARNNAIANINERYKAKREKPFQDDAGTKYLQQLRETEAMLSAQLAGEERIGAAQREQARFEQLIADLKEKRILTADQKSILASEEQSRAQLEKNVAIEREIRIKEDLAKADAKRAEAELRFAERAAQIQQGIASNREGRQDQYGRELGAFGRGDAARQQIEEQRSIYRDFERMQLQLTKATPEHLLGSDQYMTEVVLIKQGLDQALADSEAYYAALRAQQADWSNGASRAYETYLENSRNVSAQVEDMFGNAFKGMEDALVQFVRTGKLDFGSLANSIIADLARIAIRAQLAGIFGALITPSSGTAGGAGTITGGSGLTVPAPRSWAVGIDRVPYDGFIAQLHKDERVVPAKFNPAVRGPDMVGSSGGMEVELNVINNGAPVRAEQSVRQSGTKMIVDLVLREAASDVASGGTLGSAITKTYGFDRPTRRRG